MATTLRTCIDPACTWELTEESSDLIPIERVWAGSVEVTRHHHDLIEFAIRRHIIEDHGAADPLAWAEAMVRQVLDDA